MLHTKPGYAAVTAPERSRLINDPRGPERVLPTLTSEELAALIDALYRNLDTPSPELGADAWYELAVEEADRRSAPVSNDNRSAIQA